MHKRMQWLIALTAAALTACGGGGDTGAGPGVVTATAAHGTMTKTSATTIAVNGLSFDVGGASIRIDDRVATAGGLRDGMRVRVKGSRDGAGDARASEVEAEIEVRGAVTAVSAATSPQFFDIGNVRIIVDATTVYGNLVPAGFAAIRDGLFVEVHGSRDAAGNVLATRIEGKGPRDANAPEIDELGGLIGTVNGAANQFTIGAITVTYTASTAFTPPTRCTAASLGAGLRVEAHGAFTAADAFAATRIDCEDMEDEARSPSSGDETSIEGLVAGLDTVSRSFAIDGQKVTYSATTQFRNGTESDLANNVAVEVEGRFDGTTLVAREIEFER